MAMKRGREPLLEQKRAQVSRPSPHLRPTAVSSLRVKRAKKLSDDDSEFGLCAATMLKVLGGVHPQGMNDDDLYLKVGFTQREQAEALNDLLSEGRVKVSKFDRGNGTLALHFFYVPAEQAAKRKDLDKDHLYILQWIEAEGNKGIWSRDLNRRAKAMPNRKVTRILKHLQAKRIIKQVSSIAAKHRKVYMLYELQPAVEVTGGSWYTDNVWDEEFVSLVSDVSRRLIQKQGWATTTSLSQSLREQGVFKHVPKDDEMRLLLDSMVLDGRLSRIAPALRKYFPAAESVGDDVAVYRASESFKDSSSLAAAPCGVCPVVDKCSPDGEINPSSCPYLKQWMDF